MALGQLWGDPAGDRRVPCVLAFTDGDFGFGLGRFEDGWRDDIFAFVGFRDLELSTSDTQNKR